MTTVFWPTTVAGAREFRDTGVVADQRCYADTEEVYRSRQLTPDQTEDATYWAQTLAAIRSLRLTDDEPRVVLAADLKSAQVETVPDGEVGAVLVPRLEWRRVIAVFADDADAAEALQAARGAFAEGDEATAWSSAPVQELIEEQPMLWYLPVELDQI